MRKQNVWIAATAAVCLFGALHSCDVEGPDRYVRPPIIKSFLPANPSLVSGVGDSLKFSLAAMDPDHQSLDYYFLLGDSVTGDESQWTYVVEDTGDIDVDGRVTNGAAESSIRWHVKRIVPLNLRPVIVSVMPSTPEITVIVGASVEFLISAEDPEGKPLSYVYTIEETIVGVARQFVYHATVVGTFNIRAVVSDGETFASYTWTVQVAAEGDYTPPARVVITSIGPGVESGEVEIEWTAVGDDGMEGLPSEYMLKTSPQPISDENAWFSSSVRFGEPTPAEPGTTMRMTVRELPPAQTVFIAVRALDDFGNLSPLSDLASTKSRGLEVYGTVTDALSGRPVEGIQVKLLNVADTTGSDGSFALLDLPAGTGYIRVEDEPFRTQPGEYFDIVVSPYTIADEDVIALVLLPNAPLESDLYIDFLDWYRKLTDMSSTTADLLDRWEIPCRVYVPPFAHNGIDYGQGLRDAFIEWEDAIGKNVFEFVDAVPDTGVYVVFSDTEEVDNYFVTRQDSRHMTIQGQLTMRTIYALDTYEAFLKVSRHEVGHAVGLGHSFDAIHLMVGGQASAITHPSNDEIGLAKCIYNIPRGFPVAWFQND